MHVFILKHPVVENERLKTIFINICLDLELANSFIQGHIIVGPVGCITITILGLQCQYK